ncbi:uncharacterized protein LOC109421476 [Aedes albopictus]|uniref:Odorant receptor n=1 Tax=Aedes albopictus TaxID=7160 RepID=A0ABM1YIE2_AEDAL|nr:uncharacterized protein LOC109421476 [Aedes albopictus]
MFLAARKWWSNQTKLKPEKDAFFILDYFLVVSGIQLRSRNNYLRAAWNVYRMLIVMQVILIARKIWSIFQTEDNFQLISNSLHMCVGFSIIFTRIFFIVRSFKQVNGVRWFVNQRKFRADDPAAFAIRQRTYANTINITIAMILNCFVQTVIVLFTDLANSESLQLPFYLTGVSSLENNLLEKIHSGMFSVYVYFASTNFLAVFLPLSTLKAEMEVVGDAFDKIMDHVDVRMAALELNEIDEIREEQFWKILQEELTQCFIAHTAVLDKVKDLKKLTDPTFLMLYYMTMLFIAVGVMAVLFSPQFDSFNTLSLEYSFRYTLECYSFCYVVSRFNEEVGKNVRIYPGLISLFNSNSTTALSTSCPTSIGELI